MSNSKDIQHGTKFYLDGNTSIVYRYKCKHHILEKNHIVIQTSTGEQCNAALFPDHILVYKYVGLIQLESKIELNRLTILN